MSWRRVLGRVAFVNCDPVFSSLDGRWQVLPAPPAWLTGHLLRRDCLTAPIPTADYALHADEMHLLPNLGIVSKGNVGSVLLFGSRPIESMRDIALPSDSSTSQSLLKWLLEENNLDPKLMEMGPDIETMLSDCDGALLIGDRALSAASRDPGLVQLDLGAEWTNLTGFPMVFGVFAARMDSPIELVREAHDDMVEQYSLFESDSKVRATVIGAAAERLGFTMERMESYFEREVSNVLDSSSISGLLHFLREVCGMEEEPTWLSFD